jgi:hypothetical protein
MPRPATARPLGEHLALLARMVRQVDVSRRLTARRRKAVKGHLVAAMKELQAELTR